VTTTLSRPRGRRAFHCLSEGGWLSASHLVAFRLLAKNMRRSPILLGTASRWLSIQLSGSCHCANTGGEPWRQAFRGAHGACCCASAALARSSLPALRLRRFVVARVVPGPGRNRRACARGGDAVCPSTSAPGSRTWRSYAAISPRRVRRRGYPATLLAARYRLAAFAWKGRYAPTAALAAKLLPRQFIARAERRLAGAGGLRCRGRTGISLAPGLRWRSRAPGRVNGRRDGGRGGRATSSQAW